MFRVFECGDRNIGSLDDGMSDASTIAYALSTRCLGEYQESVRIKMYELSDPMAQRLFWQKRSTPAALIQTFLPIVIDHRQKARANSDKPSREQLGDKTKDAIKLESLCIAERVAEVDDGVTEIVAVARRLANLCSREHGLVVRAVVDEHPSMVESERRRLGSDDEWVKICLDTVADHRRLTGKKSSPGSTSF